MTKRVPPRLASWIAAHIAPSYRRDSFVGDLLEEYRQGQGHTACWYWGQVVVALTLAATRFLRIVFSLSSAELLLRIAAESLAVTALLSLAYELQNRHAYGSANFIPALAFAILALICSGASMLYSPLAAIRRGGKA